MKLLESKQDELVLIKIDNVDDDTKKVSTLTLSSSEEILFGIYDDDSLLEEDIKESYPNVQSATGKTILCFERAQEKKEKEEKKAQEAERKADLLKGALLNSLEKMLEDDVFRMTENGKRKKMRFAQLFTEDGEIYYDLMDLSEEESEECEPIGLTSTSLGDLKEKLADKIKTGFVTNIFNLGEI